MSSHPPLQTHPAPTCTNTKRDPRSARKNTLSTGDCLLCSVRTSNDGGLGSCRRRWQHTLGTQASHSRRSWAEYSNDLICRPIDPSFSSQRHRQHAEERASIGGAHSYVTHRPRASPSCRHVDSDYIVTTRPSSEDTPLTHRAVLSSPVVIDENHKRHALYNTNPQVAKLQVAKWPCGAKTNCGNWIFGGFSATVKTHHQSHSAQGGA